MPPSRFNRSFFVLGLFLTPLLVYYSFTLAPKSDPLRRNTIKYSVPLNIKVSNSRRFSKLKSYEKDSRWIVITSVAAKPTKAIRALAEEPGWRMVIVGDTKGPMEPLDDEWIELGGHVEVVTVQRQQTMGYSILGALPYKSYTRKMIGYLYAIERGAEWIYDTDDDNRPIGLGLGQFDYGDTSYGMIYKPSNLSNRTLHDSVFNPYAFFGRQDMWPRGYPLTLLRKDNKAINQLLCSSMRAPAVQQGLVDQDPDVDAIYRLIHADPQKGLNEKFDSHAPPITLAPGESSFSNIRYYKILGVFSPFNSQNTLFHRDAFFTMGLPIGVAFRVTDIWRGYFGQKLLHMVGRSIGFYPVNAVQDRNPHSYLEDFKDEKALYFDADRLVEELTRFKCLLNTTEYCILSLSEMFVEKGFWTAVDHQLIRLWLKDLEGVGYELPALRQDHFQYSSCRPATLFFQKPIDSQNLKKHNDMKELMVWCNKGLDGKDKFVTNVFVEKQKEVEAVGPPASVLQRMYEGYFAHVVYCGPFGSYEKMYKRNPVFPPLRRMSWINLTNEEMHDGFFAYMCTIKAIEMRIQNIDGYVTLADDAIFNLWTPFAMDHFRLKTASFQPYHYWLSNEFGLPALGRTTERYKQAAMYRSSSALGRAVRWFDRELHNFGHHFLMDAATWAVSDFYYLPKEFEHYFRTLGNVMLEERVFHEIALARLAAPMGWWPFFINATLMDIPNSLQLWFRRDNYSDLYSDSLLFIHPVKLSYTSDLTNRSIFCQSVVKSFVRNLRKEEHSITVKHEPTPISVANNDSQVFQCCQQSSELPKSCHHLCNVETINPVMILELMGGRHKDCELDGDQFVSLMKCFIENAEKDDLEECCQKRFLQDRLTPEVCEDFCSGNLTEWRMPEYRRYCDEITVDIVQCYAWTVLS
ncbi:hypothetical protein QR680_007865 [Steinernema hermaphroditum]|uniref:Domain of unknown function DB domain-containing protein n=1 Tax=Steinernema hermaphroditum TaxID=289476 RepID=A0AA39IEH1_9BILA|nr:hypothetical protein QR680_007865 [Steinernema hermaphroditum]